MLLLMYGFSTDFPKQDVREWETDSLTGTNRLIRESQERDEHAKHFCSLKIVNSGQKKLFRLGNEMYGRNDL